MKRCVDCGELKELDQFNINRANPDGHCRWCRDCNRIRNQRARSGRQTAQVTTQVVTNNVPQSGRRFGVEIEVITNGVTQSGIAEAIARQGVNVQAEGYNHTTRNYWKVITDSSCGYEVVSPILRGQDGHEQLKRACEGLKVANAKVNRTCGVHVHHEASDFTGANVQRLVQLYQNYETAIDELMAPSRRGNGNQFCKSIRNVTIQQMQYDRYYKVNLTVLRSRGTIEFRQHGATIEYGKINMWVELTRQMMEWAKGTDEMTGSGILGLLDTIGAGTELRSAVCSRAAYLQYRIERAA